MALLKAFQVECLKIRHSKTIWVTFIAFALAPVMGGIFMVILNNPELSAQSSALSTKARMMSVTVSWSSYIGVLSQAAGVGGVIIFGFVISWLFGREYSDGTVKDLLAMPVSRAKILQAKFIVYFFWCLALAISNLLLGLIIGLLLGLPGFSQSILTNELYIYFVTTLLTILIGTPVAFFALIGKGYLAPLGFLVLSIVFAQIIAAIGFGIYFPWAVPGIYSGSGGAYKDALNFMSYFILVMTSFAGYFMSIIWWHISDQT